MNVWVSVLLVAHLLVAAGICGFVLLQHGMALVSVPGTLYGQTLFLFHALNGLRVIAVDFWSKGPKYQRQMLWSVVGIWVVLMAGAFYPVLQHSLHELFGSR